MALLPIVQYPAEILARSSQVVTAFDEDLRRLAADMAETMYAAPGIGLAAPQVGKSIRLVVIDISDEKNQLLALVNPTVTALTDTLVEGEEVLGPSCRSKAGESSLLSKAQAGKMPLQPSEPGRGGASRMT